MARSVLPLAIALAVLLTSGCRREEREAEAPAAGEDSLGVLVTLAAQLPMVRAIGGERVDVTALVPPGQSPHLYEPTPSMLRAAGRAELYLTVGSGVEFERTHLATLQQQNPDLVVVACAEGIPLRPMAQHAPEEPGDHGEHRDHGGHHDHGGTTDPHVWLVPAHLRTMADAALAALIAADPGGEADYRAGHERHVRELDALDAELRDQLAPHAGRAFLVYHPSWGYFADAYGLRQIAVEEGGRQPGPAGIAAVAQQARAQDIRVVFASPQFDTTAAETVAREIDGRVVQADPLAEDVAATLRTLASALVEAFEGGDG